MNQITVEPTCKYGHGLLKMVDHMHQKQVTFGLFMRAAYPSPSQSLEGLNLWVCASCGYSEIFDDDVGVTLRNMVTASE